MDNPSASEMNAEITKRQKEMIEALTVRGLDRANMNNICGCSMGPLNQCVMTSNGGPYTVWAQGNQISTDPHVQEVYELARKLIKEECDECPMECDEKCTIYKLMKIIKEKEAEEEHNGLAYNYANQNQPQYSVKTP